MQYKFITVPAFDPARGEAELNAFLNQHHVLACDRRFVDSGQESAWTVCISYLRAGELKSGPTLAPSVKSDKVDYREVLSPEDFAVFVKLRDLRKTLAEQSAVPAYTLFTNKQLAAMVTERVTSKVELARVDGVGEARVGKYGDAFVEVLRVELGAPTAHAPA